MRAGPAPEQKSVNREAFDHYLRKGERLTNEEWLGRQECKFNPYHDELGRFTSPPGVTVSYGNRVAEATGSSRNDAKLRTAVGSRSINKNRANNAREPIGNDGLRGSIARQTTILPSKSLGARARSIARGHNELLEMPDMHVVLFGPGVKLMPVPVATFQEFDAAAKLATRLGDLDAVITGPQFEVMAGSEGLHGQAIIGGRVYGKSAPDLYYFGTVAGDDGVSRLAFGKGDPSNTSVDVGFGGGIPLLMDGKDVPGFNVAWDRYSTDRGTGKNIVAYNSSSNRAAIFIQPHGGNGHDLRVMKEYIRNSGYNYALVFDGSGSTSLNYQGNQVISPEMRRQPFIPLGIGFRSR